MVVVVVQGVAVVHHHRLKRLSHSQPTGPWGLQRNAALWVLAWLSQIALCTYVTFMKKNNVSVVVLRVIFWIFCWSTGTFTTQRRAAQHQHRDCWLLDSLSSSSGIHWASFHAITNTMGSTPMLLLLLLLAAYAPTALLQQQQGRTAPEDPKAPKLSDFVVAIPVDTNHWDVAEAGRLWRKVHWFDSAVATSHTLAGSAHACRHQRNAARVEGQGGAGAQRNVGLLP